MVGYSAQNSEIINAESATDKAFTDSIITDVASIHNAIDDDWNPLVSINQGKVGHKPFYCIHGAGGNVLNFRDLARHIGNDIPFIGLQARGVDGRVKPHQTIEEMAGCYLKAIRSHQPNGPYRLGGYSGSGVVALEIAQRLLQQGEKVEVLALIDTIRPDLKAMRVPLSTHLKNISERGTGYVTDWVKERINYRNTQKMHTEAIEKSITNGEAIPIESREWYLTLNFWAALAQYKVKRYSGSATLFTAEEIWVTLAHLGEDKGWREVIPNLAVQLVPGDHDTLVLGKNVKTLAEKLRSELV